MCATRTLVISDLHLGTRFRRDVLRKPRPLELLEAALEGVDRLILLGDIVELLEARAAQSVPIAEPILRRIARHPQEIVFVPGNHDAQMVRPYLRRHGMPADPSAAVPNDATPLLNTVTGWLGAHKTTVQYPGVWLDDTVWATHGHYLDRHLLPEGAFGIARGLIGRLPSDGAVPADYESGPSLTKAESVIGRLPEPLARTTERAVHALRAATMPRRGMKLLDPRWAPLTSLALSFQMRSASIPALARVVHRLGVDAETVIFGHVHRRGPLDGDPVDRWTGPTGRPKVLNTGSWTYEPLLVHRATPPHPYWPGGAILLEHGQPPRSVGLLDGLTAGDLSDPVTLAVRMGRRQRSSPRVT